jgi:hypothetical protein
LPLPAQSSLTFEGYTMLTTDFTGTYDYEMEEAHHAAQYIVEEFTEGFIESSDELHHRINKERMHWKKCLPETFEDFDKHFIAYLRQHLPASETLNPGVNHHDRRHQTSHARRMCH